MTTPQEPAPDTETDVTPGDVTERESDDSSDVEDSSTTAPLDADEGDPDPDDSVPAG